MRRYFGNNMLKSTGATGNCPVCTSSLARCSLSGNPWQFIGKVPLTRQLAHCDAQRTRPPPPSGGPPRLAADCCLAGAIDLCSFVAVWRGHALRGAGDWEACRGLGMCRVCRCVCVCVPGAGEVGGVARETLIGPPKRRPAALRVTNVFELPSLLSFVRQEYTTGSLNSGYGTSYRCNAVSPAPVQPPIPPLALPVPSCPLLPPSLPSPPLR